MFGQTFAPEIEEGKLTLEADIYPGYKTFFDFSENEVTRGWWRFSRKFGKPVNMRKYYETTIPTEEGGYETVLFSKTLKYGSGSMFYLVLKNKGLSSSLEERYLGQVKDLLRSFKQGFYLSFYEQQLKELEKQAARVTRKLDKSRGNAQMEQQSFEELEKVNYAIDNIRSKVKTLQ